MKVATRLVLSGKGNFFAAAARVLSSALAPNATAFDGNEIEEPSANAPGESASAQTEGDSGQEKSWNEVAPGLTVGGSLRFRYEVRDDFKFNEGAAGNDEDFLLPQMRINLDWAPVDWLGFYVEAQDARMFGEQAINDKAVPTIFADGLDLHQAYADLKSAFLKMRAGHQKLNFGSQRLVGALEWVNTARVFDAALVTLGTHKERTVDVFASKVVPVNPQEHNGHGKTGNRMFDSELLGVYYTDWMAFEGSQLESYWLLRRNSLLADEVHTLGMRFERKGSSWDSNLEVAGQLGDFQGMQHRALAAHGGVGRSWSDTRLGVAYNFASGDSDPNDSRHGTFDNLYPTNHKFYGYMDLFAWQNLHNFETTFKWKTHGWAARVAYHAFWLPEAGTDAWYNAGGGGGSQGQQPRRERLCRQRGRRHRIPCVLG